MNVLFTDGPLKGQERDVDGEIVSHTKYDGMGATGPNTLAFTYRQSPDLPPGMWSCEQKPVLYFDYGHHVMDPGAEMPPFPFPLGDDDE